MKFLDASIPNQEEFANSTSASIRAIIANLSEKFEGKNIIEAGGVTALDFDKVRNGAKFAVEYLKDIGTYIEENNDERIILRNCCAIIKAEEDVEPNLNQKYVLDIFEHIYNNEIIVDKDIEKVLEAEGSELDFLGDKLLKETGKSIELYKLKY